MTRTQDCIARIDWTLLFVATALTGLGVALTLTWVGAVVGIPMLFVAFAIFTKPTTLRGTPCA